MAPSEQVKPRFRIRLMSPLGRYPTEGFRSETASLVVSPEICFSIVTEEGEDLSIMEMECFTAQELPFFASILLAGEAGSSFLRPYPTAYQATIETDTVPSDEECKSALLQSISKQYGDHHANSLHKPPLLGGLQYDLASDCNYSELAHLLTRLKIAGPVILRGSACLIKAQMAFQHREFGEAACIFLWIALDAAHSLVLAKLRDTGLPNPSSADAARYFERISGLGTDWERFFEDDYDRRICAIHPDNRFGAEAIPMLMAEDFFDLNGDLVALFHFLVTEH
jgi:hypothetical protein